MAKISYGGNYREGADPRLVDIITQAAASHGYLVEFTSGYREGDKRQHGKKNALDITLIDPTTNRRLPNYQNAESFRTYEEFAQTARQIQRREYPELDRAFRWGGYFSGPKGKYGALDLMHFDLAGERVGMAGGSWERGLTSKQRKLFPGVVSVGMKDHPVPKVDIPGPIPASRTGLDSARMTYATEGSTQSPQSSLISLLSRAPTPATPSSSLQASRAVQSFRDPRPSSGMPTLPISGRMGASAATAPSLVPPAMSGPTRSVRTEPVSADRFAGMPVNYYPQLPASRDTGTTRLAAPGAGLTTAQRSAMSAVPVPGAYASPKTPQEVAALYKGILPIAPQAPQAAPHVRSGMLSDEYTPPRQMASAPVPASIDERLRARDPMTAQVPPVPAPAPQSRMAPVPATMSPGMAVARAGLPKPVIGQDPFTMRPRTAAQDMYDSAFGAQPPIPATMSASLASSRSSYAPTAPVPASVFSREIARARTPSNNIIRAGDYTYTKGPQGYQKVSPSMVASTSGGGSSQVASWRDPNATSQGIWPF